MNNIEQQFAGNYVRLVNQVRDLQGDIAVKNKMLELLAEKELIKYIKQQAIKQLIAEQNKKAADNASI